VPNYELFNKVTNYVSSPHDLAVSEPTKLASKDRVQIASANNQNWVFGKKNDSLTDVLKAIYEYKKEHPFLNLTDEAYKQTNPFVYEQLLFLERAWLAAGDKRDPSKETQEQIKATTEFLRQIANTGSNYAIITLDTFLPVDRGIDPQGHIFRGNGEGRKFGSNKIEDVKTLQYGVVNLDDHSVVGFDYSSITERINKDEEVIKLKRDSTKNMEWSKVKGSNSSTTVQAVTSVKNEISPIIVNIPALGFALLQDKEVKVEDVIFYPNSRTPSIDYTATVEINNMKEVTVTYTIDKFPSYEAYISINGGNFNTLYEHKAIPFDKFDGVPFQNVTNNDFYNLAFERGNYTHTLTYDPNYQYEIE
jgi:hypothetical protein